MPKLYLRTVITATLIGLSFPVSGCTKAAKASRHLDRADEYFSAGDYDKAKLEYMGALRADRNNRKANARLGQIWLEQGSPLKAGAYLLKTRQLEPTNLESRVRLARAFANTGQFDEATKEALSILDSSPDDPDALLLLVETIRTPQDLTVAEERLERFSEKTAPAYHLAAASIALRKGDRAAAEQAVEQAIAVGTKSVEAHNAMGLLHLARNQPEQAEKAFKAAADLAPVRSAARVRFAEYLSSTGRNEEAIAYATDLTKQAPDFLSAWIFLARIAINAKQYDQGLSLLNNVFSRDADNVDGRLLQAQAWLATGEIKKAVEQLERMNKAYASVPIIKYQLARAYVESKNVAQAAVTVEQALAIDPNYVDAILLLAELNIRAGKADVSVKALENLRKTRPDLAQARLVLADAYRTLGRQEDAAALFREQVRNAPPSAEPYYYTGVLLREQNKPAEARQAFEKALELAPDNTAPIEQLVEMDIAEKKFDAAMQRVDKLFQKNANSAPAYFLQAKIFVAQEQWDRAEAALLKALEIDPKIEAAYRMLIATYLAAGKLPQAIERIEKAVAQKPADGSALLVLGMGYSQIKEYLKARDAYERVLKIEPNSAVALNNLAFLYSEQLNEIEKAQEFAVKARAAAPNNPNVADTLGWILFKRRDYQQASTLLRESATKLPDNPVVQFHSGMAHYMMGNTDEARTALRKAVDSPEEFSGKEDARNRLRLLEESSAGGKELSVAELEQIVKNQPDDVVALVRLGERLEKEGAFVRAAEAFRKAFEQNPKLLQPPLKLAQLYGGALKNQKEALEFAKKARDLAPTNPSVAAVLGRIAYDAGNFTWAFSLLQEGVRVEGANAAALHSYAWAAYSLGKVQDAVDGMRRLLKASGNDSFAADANTFLEMVEMEQRRAGTTSLEARVREVLGTDPVYVPALMVRALIEQERGDVAGAIGTYNQVLQRYPDFAPAQKRLAALYAVDPQQQEKAYTLATNARKALPDDAELAMTLARLSYGRKEHRRVIQLLEEAGQKSPLDPLSLYFLGMSQLQVAQKEAGRQSLEKALAGGLREPEAAEAKKALDKSGQP
jgi:tetratricopeptide (TPR) repeat protein